jgi:hypothetical protein
MRESSHSDENKSNQTKRKVKTESIIGIKKNIIHSQTPKTRATQLRLPRLIARTAL